jgi:acetylornithine deacetylase
MTDYAGAVAELARDLVRIDSRSPLSNRPLAERIEAELAGFEIERLDYRDRNGVEKRALVAHRGGKGGLALSGHMDTVPSLERPDRGRAPAGARQHRHERPDGRGHRGGARAAR